MTRALTDVSGESNVIAFWIRGRNDDVNEMQRGRRFGFRIVHRQIILHPLFLLYSVAYIYNAAIRPTQASRLNKNAITL